MDGKTVQFVFLHIISCAYNIRNNPRHDSAVTIESRVATCVQIPTLFFPHRVEIEP